VLLLAAASRDVSWCVVSATRRGALWPWRREPEPVSARGVDARVCADGVQPNIYLLLKRSQQL
jgi:hypothetical protein